MATWKTYLIIDEIPIKSSINPTIAKGKQYIGNQNLNNEQEIQVTTTKAKPPPEGMGLVWELLSLGLTRKYTESQGIIFDNNIHVIIPEKKLVINRSKNLKQ